MSMEETLQPVQPEFNRKAERRWVSRIGFAFFAMELLAVGGQSPYI